MLRYPECMIMMMGSGTSSVVYRITSFDSVWGEMRCYSLCTYFVYAT